MLLQPQGAGSADPNSLSSALILLIPIVATLGIAVFLTVVGWAKQRRLEREAFYRSQLHQRMLERDQLSVEYLEKERAQRWRMTWQRRRDALRLGGFLLLAMGAALFVTLSVVGDSEAPPVGFIPAALGIVLVLFAQFSPPPSGGEPPSGS